MEQKLHIILMHYLYRNVHLVYLPATRSRPVVGLGKPSRQMNDKDFSAQGELKIIMTLCLYSTPYLCWLLLWWYWWVQSMGTGRVPRDHCPTTTLNAIFPSTLCLQHKRAFFTWWIEDSSKYNQCSCLHRLCVGSCWAHSELAICINSFAVYFLCAVNLARKHTDNLL